MSNSGTYKLQEYLNSEAPPVIRKASECIFGEINIDEEIHQGLVKIATSTESTSVFNPNPIPNKFLARQATNAPKVYLTTISKVVNINSLNPVNPLELKHKSLSIIFGNNGSGKSSYVRILKGVNNPKVFVKADIYEESPPQEGACSIAYKKDPEGKESSYDYKVNYSSGRNMSQENPDLHGIDIFDTDMANTYLGNKNLTYSPPILAKITTLISCLDQVKSDISSQIDAKKNSNSKTAIPDYLPIENPLLVWYNNVSHKTPVVDIESYCRFSEDENTKLNQLFSLINTKDLSEKIQKLKTHNNEIEKIQQTLLNLNKAIGLEKELIEANNAMIVAQEASSKLAETTANMPLKGVGTEAWKELWIAAEKYSTTHAYPGIAFPVTDLPDTKCVLCQQNLEADAAQRFINFTEFMASDLEKKLNSSKMKFSEIKQKISTDLLLNYSIETALNATNISDTEANKEHKTISNDYQNLKDTVSNILSKTTGESYIDIETAQLATPPELMSLAILSTAHKNNLQSVTILEQGTESDEYKKNHQEYFKLLAKQFVASQKDTLIKYRNDASHIAHLEQCRKNINSKKLTSLSAEISQELINQSYVDAFNQELKSLGSKLKAEIKFKTAKGVTASTIALKAPSDHKIQEILSEGERRIIGLAAFLAETQQNPSRAPFIFDDPVSSLDDLHEEQVAKRLVGLAQDRQVIVFTHRLTLLQRLDDALEYFKPSTTETILTQIEGKGSPCTIDPLYLEPEKALKTLKGSIKSEDVTGECATFRKILERVVEHTLLNKIVVRARKSVMTKGKLHSVCKAPNGSWKLVDDLMTKYSTEVHSQSGEMGGHESITAEDLKEDCDKVIAMIDEIKKSRKKPDLGS